jgi:hypothetical protein
MIESLVFEAKIVGFKEGLKIGIVWLVLYSYLFTNNRTNLIRPFYSGLFVSLFLALSFLLMPVNSLSSGTLGNVISMSFAVFLIMSGAALYHASGVNLFFGKSEIKSELVIRGVVFLLTVFFFLPDLTGSVLFLHQLAVLKESAFMTAMSAGLGLGIAAVIFIVVIQLYKPFWLGSFFAIPQLLLFLAMVKLFGSGIKGIAELSLIPSVQRGFMKFIHDLVHQTFVMLMVPDHPLLKQTTWDFIAVFFGQNMASIASLILLLALPLIFIYHNLLKPLPAPEGETKVSRRKVQSILLSERRKKALPIIVYGIIIVAAWFSHGGEEVSKLYDPAPRPVVADSGVLSIPIQDATMNLMDGGLHKFSLTHEGEEIRLIIVKKEDNSLSVCLDACEICPPDGYGQKTDYVVCVYCNTPIPIHTLGEPGGCNPIPLTATIDERSVRIEMAEIIKKWEFVTLK